MDTTASVKYVICTICNGNGMLIVPLNQEVRMPCPACNNTGKIAVDER